MSVSNESMKQHILLMYTNGDCTNYGKIYCTKIYKPFMQMTTISKWVNLSGKCHVITAKHNSN